MKVDIKICIPAKMMIKSVFLSNTCFLSTVIKIVHKWVLLSEYNVSQNLFRISKYFEKSEFEFSSFTVDRF